VGARGRTWWPNGLLILASLLAGCLMIEGLIAVGLAYPDLLAASLGPNSKALALARSYYARRDRRIVQFLPACAVYEPEVTYALRRGGQCTVANREHTVEYAANRAGLRDDDTALERPVVVVTGDSHAMGWGVAAAESFPKVMQRRLGVSVLNAAMSSYGTARELALLERLGLADFQALVIQYADNDFRENRRLIDRGGLDIAPEARYQALVAKHARDTRYHVFKYLGGFVSAARRAMPWRRAPRPGDTSAEEARYFLEVLRRHLGLIEGRVVVVLELSERNRNGDRFPRAVTSLLADPRFAGLRPWVSAIDVSKTLTADDFYVLDDHMRPPGHAKVAAVIEAELRRRGVPLIGRPGGA
jgi:hypothetical protein